MPRGAAMEMLCFDVKIGAQQGGIQKLRDQSYLLLISVATK